MSRKTGRNATPPHRPNPLANWMRPRIGAQDDAMSETTTEMADSLDSRDLDEVVASTPTMEEDESEEEPVPQANLPPLMYQQMASPPGNVEDAAAVVADQPQDVRNRGRIKCHCGGQVHGKQATRREDGMPCHTCKAGLHYRKWMYACAKCSSCFCKKCYAVRKVARGPSDALEEEQRSLGLGASQAGLAFVSMQ